MSTEITPTTSSTYGTQAERKVSKSIDKDAFLLLLVAQLKNQDPNQAQDTGQMVQQMTGFATLEQLQNSNELLQGLQVQNHGLFQAQAANMVGKRARLTSSSVELQGGKAVIGLDLAEGAEVNLTIKDKNGQIVAIIEKGKLASGSHTVEWDGLDLKGEKLGDGQYKVEVSAKNAEGKDVGASTSAFAKIDSVLFLDGAIYVFAGGKRFLLSDVTEIAA